MVEFGIDEFSTAEVGTAEVGMALQLHLFGGRWIERQFEV
jgi:hypothetical protein